MTVFALFLLNTLVAIYYAKKRWYVASIMFVLSSAVLFGMLVFISKVPFVADGIIDFIGAERYITIQEALVLHTTYAVSPYLAIVLLMVIATVVVTLETAATLIDVIKRARPQTVAHTSRIARRLCRLLYIKRRKTYLTFCTMLC